MIELWLSFLSSLPSFTPFVLILIIISVVCSVLLLRSFKLW